MSDERNNQESPESTKHGFDPKEVAEAIIKAKPNGRSFLAQLVAILISIGVLGGGGYVGLDVIRSELVNTKEAVKEVRLDVKEIRKTQAESARNISDVRLEILQAVDQYEHIADDVHSKLWARISQLEQKLARCEALLEQLRR